MDMVIARLQRCKLKFPGFYGNQFKYTTKLFIPSLKIPGSASSHFSEEAHWGSSGLVVVAVVYTCICWVTKYPFFPVVTS